MPSNLTRRLLFWLPAGIVVAGGLALLFFVLPIEARWFLGLEVLFAFLGFLNSKDLAGFIGVVSGVAMMILVTIIKDKIFSKEGKVNEELVFGLGKMLVWLLVFDLFLSLSDVAVHYFGEGESHETAALLLMGAFAPFVIGVETLMGKVLPLVLSPLRPCARWRCTGSRRCW